MRRRRLLSRRLKRTKKDAVDFSKALSSFTPLGPVVAAHSLAESGQKLARSAPKAIEAIKEEVVRNAKTKFRPRKR